MTKYIYNYETIEININLNNLNDLSTLFAYFNESLNKISIYSKKSLIYNKEEILSSDIKKLPSCNGCPETHPSKNVHY